MNLTVTPERQQIGAAIDSLVARHLPIESSSARGSAPTPLDYETWTACAEAGWFGLGLDAAIGGSGLGAAEETILFRRVGRHLVPGPLLGTVLGAHVAVASGETALATALVAGERRCAIAVGDLAIDAEAGELLVRLGENHAQIVADATLEPQEGVDVSAATTRVSGGRVVAGCPGSPINARAQLLVASTALGVIDAVSAMSVGYARDRVQFGVPIGSFQAVKHRCADMAVAAYAVEALVAFAAHHVDSADPAAAFQCAAAHLLAISSVRRSVADNIQNHGAIGFTMEHDAHLFLRRAHVLEHILGPMRNTIRAVLAPERHEFS
jgi:alkylation response protein AidB-like acyl-CoA dehydrogenase